MGNISKEEEPKRFIYATVYESDLYKTSNGEEFVVCKACKNPNKIKKDSTGYCESCEEPLGDYQGDVASPELVEEAQLSYMKSINDKIIGLDNIIKSLLSGQEFDLMDYIKVAQHHIGDSHTIFKQDNGYLASSHCEFEEFDAFGETFKKCIWKMGMIVSPEIFEKVKNGTYKSYSFGGNGERTPLNE